MKTVKSAKKETRTKVIRDFLLLTPFLVHAALFVWMFSDSNTIVKYDLDNYRYIYSALLQVVGSLFAFIASSTLVVLQLLHSIAPNSARFYPKNIFSFFLVTNIIVLIGDASVILFLEPTVKPLKQIILNLVITLNIYPLLFAFLYIYRVIRYLTPNYLAAHIIRQAKNAKTNYERRCIVYSLEEMILTSIKAGQGGNVCLYQDVFWEIISIFTNTRTELNSQSKFDPYHPLRIIPDIIERVASSLIDNGMNNLLHYNGHILRHLSGSKYNGTRIVDVEIALAVKHIARVCLAHSCTTDLSNFSADFIMCADESSDISTILWGTRHLIDVLCEAPAHEAAYIFNDVISYLHHLIKKVDLEDGTEYKQMILYLESKKDFIQICAENVHNDSEKELRDMKDYINQKYKINKR